MTDNSSGLRIAFFGTPEFAAHILKHLVQNGEKVVVCVTTPDKPQGRGLKLKGSVVRETAASFDIPVLTPIKHKDPQFLEALDGFQADLFVVVAYKILPPEVYTMPRLGSFNVHASLLPKYRGAAPINWAIIRGDTVTGVTTFLLDRNVDTGQMLLSKSTPISQNETAGELHDELMVLGAEIALETIRGLADGSITPVTQPEGNATTAPKIFPPDCVVDFNRPALEVHNTIRGLSPYPGAVTVHKGVRVKLLRGRVGGESSLEPGTFRVSESGKQLFVGSLDKPVEILELQREGKRPMSTEEFLRGDNSLFHI